jgi:hypothetical protein
MKFHTMRLLVAALTAALIGVVPASAHDSGSLTHKGKYLRAKVKQEHGSKAAGRAILREGVRYCHNHRDRTRHCHIRDATKRDKAMYVRQLRKLLAPQRYSTLTTTATPPPQAPAGTATATGRVQGGHLASIRQCESGGNYRAISPGGAYRGAYQFDYQTWGSVGGSGDPAAASPAEQDKRAAMLYAQRGAQPWPVCGR